MIGLRRDFAETGYAVVRGLLTSDEVNHYRSVLQRISGIAHGKVDRNWYCGDAINRYPETWPLVAHPKLLEAVRTLLGDNVHFLQHADLHVNHDRRDWHRDNAHRQFGVGPDWDESEEQYSILRAGMYLQTYDESASSLGLIPGSHRHRLRRFELEERVRYRLRRALKMSSFLPPITTRACWIRTEPGDCILFDPRVLHAASSIKGTKYSIFVAYGAPNNHSRNHVSYYRETRRDLGYAELSPPLRSELEALGLWPPA
jgi:hypothetical protein